MTRPKLLLVGYGRMGRLVDSLASDFDMDVVGRVRAAEMSQPSRLPDADVAIDFSTATAVPANARVLAARGVSLVIGTTGWDDALPALRRELETSPVGVIAAPNFSIGVNLFLRLAETAAEMMAPRGFGAWVHEAHHAAKKDAPSGTAIALHRRVAAHLGDIDITSTRAGYIPGTHTLGFDSPAETITLTHTARDRTAFARGALEAARWIQGRHGWFTISDMLEGA